MSVYGSSLWNYEKQSVINKYFIAWRKCMRRLLKISERSHCNLINVILQDETVEVKLHRRFVKFFRSCINGQSPVRLCVQLVLNGEVNSTGSNNVCVIRDKYFQSGIVNLNCIWCIRDGIPDQTLSDTAGIIRNFLDFRHDNPSDFSSICDIVNWLCEN